jgi:predicted RNase H-like nuclease (RuvC/YqgF family)
MPANVHSLEAILAVQTALAAFRDDLEQAIATIDMEMRKVLDWLEHDRPRFWRNQLREAQDGVVQARQALHRCLMYPINDERPSCYEERAELKKAEARLAYCDEKSERLRHWIREVRHEMSEYQGRISQLKDVVDIDTPQALTTLERLVTRLEEYQAIQVSFAGSTLSEATTSFARELMPESIDTSQPLPVPADAETSAPESSKTPVEEAS